MDNAAELTVARTFTNVHDALLAKSVIEAAGIDVALADEHLVSMNWMYSTAVGGVKALVPADRLEEAQSLLDTTAVVEEETAIADRCPQCGSDEFESIPPTTPLLVFSWLFIGVPLGWPVRRRVCRQCRLPASVSTD
jgi:hypothetical protein